MNKNGRSSNTAHTWVVLYRVKHKLRVESLKVRFEIQKGEFKSLSYESTISNSRVPSSALRVTILNPRVTSLSSRVTSSNRRVASSYQKQEKRYCKYVLTHEV